MDHPGKTIGFLAFVPAGALVLGSIGGMGALFGTGWTREQATRLLSSEWLADLDKATERFRVALGAAIRSKIELLQGKRTKLPKGEHSVRKWVDSDFRTRSSPSQKLATILSTVSVTCDSRRAQGHALRS
ncbi:hypothetical protein OS035_32175 [Rhizobium sp. 268]|uniref:hypothetical protein n=1 Tax=Rhizobium sp. 268 TaxID=2996375 RepID=UPI002F95005F